MTCLPSASRLVATEYVPVALVAPLPTTTPSDRMLTVVPVAAVPVKVGVVTLVMLSPLTPESLAALSTGVDGAATGWAVPLPLSATLCGLPAALSTKVTLPVAAPVAVGLNTTLTLHDAPAATETQLLLVIANGPVTVTLLTDRAAVPVLLSVTD